MEITVYNMQKKKVGSVNLPGDATDKVSTGRIYQVVVQQRTNQRQGNARVKNRHEVSGSTRKIYRQKGTGRARHGDIKAPLFVGGGQAFGPKPRDWRSTVPEKIRRGALRDLLSLKGAENKLWLVESVSFEKPKTKEARAFFEKFKIPAALLVLEKPDEIVEKSVRNLEGFRVRSVDAVSAVDLLHYDHLVLTQKAYERLVARIA